MANQLILRHGNCHVSLIILNTFSSSPNKMIESCVLTIIVISDFWYLFIFMMKNRNEIWARLFFIDVEKAPMFNMILM